MTQYNILNVKLSNSHFNKSKFGIKNGTEVTLKLSSNLIGNSYDETNFPHKLLLTDIQVSKIRKVFENSSSANIIFSRTHLFKIQSGGFKADIFGISGVSDIKSGLDKFIELPFKLLNLHKSIM